jgi:hypothetical protein
MSSKGRTQVYSIVESTYFGERPVPSRLLPFPITWPQATDVNAKRVLPANSCHSQKANERPVPHPYRTFPSVNRYAFGLYPLSLRHHVLQK